MKAHKETTCTTLVLEALRAADDFLSRSALVRATGRSYNQVDASTHWLRKRHAIDCVVEPDGRAWWYALPPENDNRSYHVDERTPEDRPRRSRKKKVLTLLTHNG